MTPKGKLEIYDILREMHSLLKDGVLIQQNGMTNIEQTAVQGLDSVLYLVERVFAEQE